AGRRGMDHRRAVDLLRGDMDAFDEACEPIRPAWVKVQATGPWTLVASVELHTGHKVLTDRGAVREFAASLTAGLREHIAEVGARTGAKVLLQLDEPSLEGVLGGQIPTPSGYGTVRAVSDAAAKTVLRSVIDGVGVPVVLHCCASRPPMRVLADVGAAAIGIDATQRAVSGSTASPAALDALGEVWDTGVPLMLGMVPSVDPGRPVSSRALAGRAFDLADRLGFARERLSKLAVPTPTCGLAGASPAWARRALELCRELGLGFTDPPEEN
ncbi:MAG: methionine synthase, partial [Actinomycetes bacterium]